MTAFIDDTLKRASAHPRAEQLALIQALQQSLMPSDTVLIAPGVFRTPGVAGGEACLGATRIPVFRVVKFLLEGVPESEILEIFPSLSMIDIEMAKRYYNDHSTEIKNQIEADE